MMSTSLTFLSPPRQPFPLDEAAPVVIKFHIINMMAHVPSQTLFFTYKVIVENHIIYIDAKGAWLVA